MNEVDIISLIDERISVKQDNIGQYLENTAKDSNAIIYGAGEQGEYTLSLLERYRGGMDKFKFFIDSMNGEASYENKNIYTFEQAKGNIDENDIIFVSIVFLNKKTLNDVYSNLSQVNCKYVNFNKLYYYSLLKASLTDILAENRDKIVKVFNMLKDEESKKVFHDYIARIICSDDYPANCVVTSYFREDIPFRTKFRNYIECGSIAGETINDLVFNKGKAQKIALFEADRRNYLSNAKFFNESKGSICDEAYLFPCGIWDGHEQLKFEGDKRGASKISERGEKTIQCINIDSALHGFAPDFIKMDVEGAEINALMGARNTISTYKPDMAISAYHELEHIWEIPSLIHDMGCGYDFYLRENAYFNFDTTLYAINKD